MKRSELFFTDFRLPSFSFPKQAELALPTSPPEFLEPKKKNGENDLWFDVHNIDSYVESKLAINQDDAVNIYDATNI